MNEKELYLEALENWGPFDQTIMLFEEMAELQKELCKNFRGRNNRQAIAEEIADVQIMLGQMIVLHDCEVAVQDYKQAKLLRLAQRLGKDVSENA